MRGLAAVLVIPLLSSGASAALPPLARVERHSIAVRLEPAAGRLSAVDVMEVAPPAGANELAFLLNRGLDVDSVRVAGRPAAFRLIEDAPGRTISGHVAVEVAAAGGIPVSIAMSYSGILLAGILLAGSREGLGAIAPAGVVLEPASGWYPRGSEDLTPFEVRVTAPEPLEAASVGVRRERVLAGEANTTTWVEEHPIPGAHVVAGPFAVTERAHGAITLLAFLLRPESHLAGAVLDAAVRHLDRFAAELGPYPWGKLAVIERAGTGAGASAGASTAPSIPSCVVLDRAALTSPVPGFDAALAHEVARGWWGHGVLPLAGEPSWEEGLLTCLVDHRLATERGEDRALRVRLVGEVVAGAGPAPRVAMLFHMLEETVGREPFRSALRDLAAEHGHERVGWRVLASRLGAVAGERLEGFFDQWLGRAGAPRLELAGAARSATGGGRHEVRFTLRQDGGPATAAYRIDVPVTLEAAGGSLRRVVRLTEREQEFTLRLTPEPRVLHIDPDVHLLRQLEAAEAAPRLGDLLGDPRLLIVRPAKPRNAAWGVAYAKLAAALTRGASERAVLDLALTDRLRQESVLFLLGGPADNAAARELGGVFGPRLALGDAGFTLDGAAHAGPDETILAVAGEAEAAIVGILAPNSTAAAAAWASRADDVLAASRTSSYALFRGDALQSLGIWDAGASRLTFHFDGGPR